MELKGKTLFKIVLLENTDYNYEGDKLNVKQIDEEGNVYYYDADDRWCILTKEEENIVWKKYRKDML
jgi:hypothetical protein